MRNFSWKLLAFVAKIEAVSPSRAQLWVSNEIWICWTLILQCLLLTQFSSATVPLDPAFSMAK